MYCTEHCTHDFIRQSTGRCTLNIESSKQYDILQQIAFTSHGGDFIIVCFYIKFHPHAVVGTVS